MKYLALALALACTGAAAPSFTAAAAAQASNLDAAGREKAGDESLEAVVEAALAAEAAERDKRAVFGGASLKAGHFVWRKDRAASAIDRVVVDLTGQMAYAYNGDELIAASTISSGTEKFPSPVGIFTVLDKQRDYRSIKYEAPMPFMQRIDNYGVALHAGHVPNRPASHGCIRLPREFAARLFKATRIGTPVLMGKPAYLVELRRNGHDV